MPEKRGTASSLRAPRGKPRKQRGQGIDRRWLARRLAGLAALACPTLAHNPAPLFSLSDLSPFNSQQVVESPTASSTGSSSVSGMMYDPVSQERSEITPPRVLNGSKAGASPDAVRACHVLALFSTSHNS